MENQAIKIFIKEQMNALDRSGSPAEAGMILLGLADYLLTNVRDQADVFKGTDPDEIRRAFLRCGSMGEKLRGFYDQYRFPVEESASRVLERIAHNNSEIEEQNQKMLQYEAEAERMRAAARRLEEEHQAVLAREQELELVKARYDGLKDKIEVCNTVIREMTPEAIDRMEAELQEVREQAQEKEQKRDSLKKETETARERAAEAASEAAKLQAEKQSLDEQEKTNRKQIEEWKQDIQGLHARNEKLAGEISVLSREIMEADGVYEDMKVFLAESQRLEQGILEEGYFDRDDFLAKLEDLKSQSRMLQESYDRVLKNVLKDARTLYDQIKARQRKF